MKKDELLGYIFLSLIIFTLILSGFYLYIVFRVNYAIYNWIEPTIIIFIFIAFLIKLFGNFRIFHRI